MMLKIKGYYLKVLAVSVCCIYIICSVIMPVYAAQLPDSELKALTEFPNWVACLSGGAGSTSSTTHPTIVLDPGHSGTDSNATDPSTGLHIGDSSNPPERVEVFGIATNIQSKLTAAGYNVVMTKQSQDVTVDLKQRADIANQAHADLAVSIHDDHSQSWSNFAQVYVQNVGDYRTSLTTGQKINFTDAAIAQKSQQYGQIFASERTKAEGHNVVVTKDTSFGGRSLGDGNIPIVQLLAKVPWVYNEVGASPDGTPLPQSEIDKYTTGLINSIEKAVPINGSGTGSSGTSSSTTGGAGSASGGSTGSSGQGNCCPSSGSSSTAASSASVDVTPGTGKPDGATFPNLDPGAMADSINKFIEKENPNSKLKGLGSTIVASAKHSNVNPFIIVAIAHEESSLADPSVYNVSHGNNSFGREAGPGQPSFQGAYSWYKWSSVKASVDYNAPENKNIQGGGDIASFLRAQYGSDINNGDIKSLVFTYAPPSQNNSAQYTSNVDSWINDMVQGAGGKGSTVSSGSSSSTSSSGGTCQCSSSSNDSVSGNISPQVGFGMSSAVQQKFQQIMVAAGQKFNVNPNFVATFYYIEDGLAGGDSTNNADSASGTPRTGDGRWKEPPPPYGHGPPYPPSNSYSATGPYQFIDSTWAIYGQDGNGDGKKDVNDLTDAAFAAADLLAQSGAKGTTSDSALRSAAFAYNHSSTYAQSALNTFHYLISKGSASVSGSGSGSACPSPQGADCSSGGTLATGDAKILCEAEQYKGTFYSHNGHSGYDAFRQECPISSIPNAVKTSTAGNPGPCSTDCSSLVYAALDQAFNLKYNGTVDTSTGIMSDATQYWKKISISQAQAGDIVTRPDHVEIVDHVSGNTVYTFGSHFPGPGGQTGPITTDASYWSSGAWHWTGPGST